MPQVGNDKEKLLFIVAIYPKQLKKLVLMLIMLKGMLLKSVVYH